MKAIWNYPFFTKAEFDCKHTGNNEMQHKFMLKLVELRKLFNQPMRITSGYRDPSHPVEAKKTHSNGEHTKGKCCDVACSPQDRYRLVALAIQLGFTRIGVANSFIHLGTATSEDGLPSPAIWIY